MMDNDKLKEVFPPMKHMRTYWKEYGDNQPVSNDKVYCCPNPACGMGRLFEWQLTNYCPHCGLRLYKPSVSKEET